MIRKSVFLLGILTLTGMLLYAQNDKQDDKKSAKITGFLVDVHCATGLDETDRKHSVSCALMPSCAASGYAVVSKDTVYRLDENGNRLALDILKSTKTKSGLGVEIVGTLKESILYVDTMKQVSKT